MALLTQLRKVFSKEQRVVRGKEASSLSRHFLTDDYVENVLIKLFNDWISTEVNEVEKRELIWKHAEAMKGFKGFLNVLETDRKMIEKEQESPS